MPHSENTSAWPDAIVRAVEPDDYVALKTLYEQPGAYTGTLQMPFPSAAAWKERIQRASAGVHALVACVNEDPVGHIGLSVAANPRQRHIGHIGMAVHDSFAGRGIGELLLKAALHLADDWLNLARVELTVYTDNERGIRLYERCGFEKEGTFRSYAFRDGAYVDAFAMARLRTA